MFKIIKITLFFLFLSSFVCAEVHPGLFITKNEANLIKSSLDKYPLLNKSYQNALNKAEIFLNQPIEVPMPGEAGGYEHERHKQNYRDMQLAGLLFTITSEEMYAEFVKKMLYEYAELYPTLGPHPLSKKQAPGKLFHQMLNENVWLVYASQAYDCIYNWLSEAEREHIEKNVFYVIIDWFVNENPHEIDRIHNHGTWSVAAIGMIGYVLGDQNLVDMALKGTKKNGKGGFLRQLDLLFSPDGYYMEGPYYIRYALRPFFLFAEAIERNQPELKIYEYRDKILKKAIYSALQTTFPDGTFPPINDASRTMNILAPGVLIATDLAYYRYGAEQNLLRVAHIQEEVILNAAGLEIAKDYGDHKMMPMPQWGSMEFTDGYDGQQGGLGILRCGDSQNQSMLLMKYGVHGEGHGHFDKLHFIFYDQNREIVPDYGFARWINIEPKFGGRYLPENNTYAKSTIAHNTVVVDQQVQNMANRKKADKVSAKRHFFNTNDEKIQVVSAKADDCYRDIKMQRTMFLVDDEQLEHPFVIDLFRLQSNKSHVYDYPIHYYGQPITASFEYVTDTLQLNPLGDDFGYQHIWREGSARVAEPIKFTWLNTNRYYSLVSAVDKSSEVIYGRIGANDPYFNLTSDPMVIIRTEGESQLFASVIEPHGYFNEAAEMSVNARGNIEKVEVIGHDDSGSVIEIFGKNGLMWTVMVNNGNPFTEDIHQVWFQDRKFEWQGNYKLVKTQNSMK